MRLRYLLLTAIIACIVSILAGGYLFSAQLYAFKVNVKKYTEINIPKNKGMFNVFMKIMNTSVGIIPDKAFVEIDESQISGLRRYVINASVGVENIVVVDSIDSLRETLLAVSEPTKILVKPGEYVINQSLNLPDISQSSGPFILTASVKGEVVFNSTIQQALIVNGANWVVEGIEFLGGCEFDTECEHAIHIVGDADNIIVQDNIFKNFNAHIKSNGIQLVDENRRQYPDNVRIISNQFYNQWQRDTRNPVTPLDVVGGDNWLVVGNFVADFAKKRGDKTTYGMYMKGGGSNGRFESNLVACEWQVRSSTYTDVRVGLSFGGGGTGNQYCHDGDCRVEHRGGIIKENTIINCPNDMAIYLNKAADTTVANNWLLNSLGVSVRGDVSSAMVRDNRIQGTVVAEDGATINYTNNTDVDFFERL